MRPPAVDPPAIDLPASRPGARLAACAIVVLAFAVPAAALVAAGVGRGPQFYDQQAYHLPTIHRFAAQWPAFDFASYPAAMTPGYHLLMAAVVRAGGGTTALQSATLGLTAGLLGTLAWWATSRVPAADAVLLCLPLAWSQYALAAGVYAVPHNLAWWGVLAVLLLVLRPSFGRTTIVAGGLLVWGLVLVRQVHVWAVLPLAAAAWAGTRGEPNDRLASRVGRVAWVALATLPAALTLGYFVQLWGGLVPVTEQPWARPAAGLNLSALTMMLATSGALGLFFLPSVRRVGSWPVSSWRAVLTGAVAAAAVAAIAETDFNEPAGRWGGLWQLARATPTVGGRSPAIVTLAAVGGGVLAAVLSAVGRRERVVWCAAGLGFAAAHAATNLAWQRYYEPMVLIALAACTAASWASPAAGPERVGPQARQRAVGRAALAVLACLQVALTAYSFR